MAVGIRKLSEKLKGKGNRKDAPKNEDVVKDKEKKPSLESSFGKKLQGNSNQSHHNSKGQVTKAPETVSSYSKMADSLDHPGSPECTSAPAYPRSQSVETSGKRSGSNQRKIMQSQDPSTAGQVLPKSDEHNEKGHEHTSSSLNSEHCPGVPAAKVDPVRPISNKMDASKTDGSSSPRIQEQPVVTVSKDAAATATTSTCTPTAHFPKLVNSSSSQASTQASTAAPPAVVSALTGEPENPVNGENASGDVQPADRPPLTTNQGSPPDANSAAAADGETNNGVNSDTTAAQLAASSPSTATDGDSQNSIDREDAASERSENRNSEQQQSLTAFPTQVEPEPTADQEPTVTAGEETPQQEETINYENFLISEKINGDKFIQDKLSVNLDRTSHRVIKNWEHLACTDEINAPLRIRLKCKMVGDNSRTMMLFEVLTSEFEDKTVKDLINALTRIKRNDVKKIITDACPDAADSTEKFSDFVACLENSELIENIATLLDQKSNVVRNWFHLGQQFKLSNETLKEIEYGPFSPTEVVMKSLYSRKTDLTIGTFYDVVKELKRHDVLRRLDPFIVGASDRDRPMKNVIGLESDAMRSICISLNNPNRAIKNWRHLCKSPALGIPEDVYKYCEPGKQRSPTDSLFEWIFGNKVKLTVGQLCSALAKIDRNDVVRDLREYFEQNSPGHLGQS